MFTYEAAIATFLGSTPTHLRAARDGRQGRADGDSCARDRSEARLFAVKNATVS
jgi:hypothetical protein